MRKGIAALRQQYEQDGVVMVPSLIGSPWIEKLLEPIQAVIAEFRDKPPGLYQHGNADLRSTDGGRITIRWLWREYPVIRQFFDDQAVLEILAGIMDTRQLKLWFDNTFVHLPGYEKSSGSPWHHDAAAFPFNGVQLPSLWITLTDTTPEMSRLQSLKGTHRSRERYRPPVYVDPNAPLPEGFVDMPDFKALVEQGAYEIAEWPEMKAGDALVIHPYAVHGAPGNTSSEKTRIAFTSRLLGDDVRWAPTPFSVKMPGDDFDELEPGAAPEGPRFPLVWKARDAAI
jgi:ectoine hydroxylase-related dioxygenase (phytanoyl-CoA dioxygenase family)